MSELFETVRERVSLRDTAALLGCEPNRAGFIRCPIHGERTASCKLYEDEGRFYCFGCHAHGDVIDLYGKTRGMRPLEAARELAGAAGIVLPSAPHRPAPPAPAPRPTDAQLWQAFEHWQRRTFLALRRYRDWSDVVLRELAPRHGTDELHPLFVEAQRDRPLVDDALLILADGSDAERLALYRSYRKELERIAKRPGIR